MLSSPTRGASSVGRGYTCIVLWATGLTGAHCGNHQSMLGGQQAKPHTVLGQCHKHPEPLGGLTWWRLDCTGTVPHPLLPSSAGDHSPQATLEFPRTGHSLHQAATVELPMTHPCGSQQRLNTFSLRLPSCAEQAGVKLPGRHPRIWDEQASRLRIGLQTGKGRGAQVGDELQGRVRRQV